MPGDVKCSEGTAQSQGQHQGQAFLPRQSSALAFPKAHGGSARSWVPTPSALSTPDGCSRSQRAAVTSPAFLLLRESNVALGCTMLQSRACLSPHLSSLPGGTAWAVVGGGLPGTLCHLCAIQFQHGRQQVLQKPCFPAMSLRHCSPLLPLQPPGGPGGVSTLK